MQVDTKLIQKIKSNKPFIVAISGFGGSGKTTYANLLSDVVKAKTISIDSFSKRITDYSFWEFFDYNRFRKEILIPFHAGKNPIIYKKTMERKNKKLLRLYIME